MIFLFLRLQQKLENYSNFHVQHVLWIALAISRTCLSSAECPTAEGYFKWIPQCSNMQMLLSEAVFTFFLLLNVFRAGIRRNNSDIINVAKARFAPPLLWTEHAFLYGNFFRDSVLRTKYPQLLFNFLINNESYSISGNDCNREWRFCAGEL